MVLSGREKDLRPKGEGLGQASCPEVMPRVCRRSSRILGDRDVAGEIWERPPRECWCLWRGQTFFLSFTSEFSIRALHSVELLLLTACVNSNHLGQPELDCSSLASLPTLVRPEVVLPSPQVIMESS
jgi:hypothetical protein